jgi:hypothetical protein
VRSNFWNQREVLANEPAFAKRARAGELHLKVLIASAGEEQYRGDDPKVRTDEDAARMIDNANELADRIPRLNPDAVVVQRLIFEGETHNSGGFAPLVRGLDSPCLQPRNSGSDRCTRIDEQPVFGLFSEHVHPRVAVRIARHRASARAVDFCELFSICSHRRPVGRVA